MRDLTATLDEMVQKYGFDQEEEIAFREAADLLVSAAHLRTAATVLRKSATVAEASPGSIIGRVASKMEDEYEISDLDFASDVLERTAVEMEKSAHDVFEAAGLKDLWEKVKDLVSPQAIPSDSEIAAILGKGLPKKLADTLGYRVNAALTPVLQSAEQALKNDGVEKPAWDQIVKKVQDTKELVNVGEENVVEAYSDTRAEMYEEVKNERIPAAFANFLTDKQLHPSKVDDALGTLFTKFDHMMYLAFKKAVSTKPATRAASVNDILGKVIPVPALADLTRAFPAVHPTSFSLPTKMIKEWGLGTA